MLVHRTQLEDVLLLELKQHSDDRGYFLETYNEKTLREAGVTERFVQDNFSHSKRHVLRGLHFQLNNPQAKLIRVVQGEIYDVAVDLRPDSATFGKWVGMSLKAEEHRLLWIPKGFAHGFCVISETADVTYKVSEYYYPGGERTLLWSDPDLAIAWPLQQQPILSSKDSAGSRLRDLAHQLS